MRRVLVNKRGNFSQLRLLFPALKIASSKSGPVPDAFAGVPVYGKYIFSDFEYPVGDTTELFLLNSIQGYAVDTLKGLCLFLRDIDYMASSKIDRLEKLAPPADHIVDFYYINAATLRVANRLTVKQEEDLVGLIELLQPKAYSLYDRVIYASKNGYKETLASILSLLDKYFDKTSSGMKPALRKMFAAIVAVLNRNELKKFQLTGDDEIDCLSLLTMFG